jgi:rubredoxin
VHKEFGHECPQCGADGIAPEWSELVSAHCVRNMWSCDICEFQFEERVCLSKSKLTAVN